MIDLIKIKIFVFFVFLIFFSSFFSGCIKDEDDSDNTVRIIGRDVVFESIMDAVNDCVDGDTIVVSKGTYEESISIYKSIKLIADDKKNTVIDAGGKGDVITVTSDNVEINGFTIKNSGNRSYPSFDAGIDIRSENNTIENNRIIYNGNHAIYLYKASNNSIINNFISNNSFGIFVDGSYASNLFGNNILENNISKNTEKAVYMSYCFNSSVKDNYITGNDYGIHLQHCDDNIIFSNSFYENNMGLFFCCGAEENIVYKNIFKDNYEYNAMSNTPNFFDYGGVGNFWDDYEGFDFDDDGIGDIPYYVMHHESIDVNNSDNYPLIDEDLI